MYKYLQEIDSSDFVIYVVVIILTSVISYRIQLSNHIIFGACMGLIIVYYIQDRSVQTGSSFAHYSSNILKSKIFNSERNRDLYRDSELVLFLYNHREYYEYNPSLFRSLVNNINMLLKLSHDIELNVQQYNEDYQNIRHLKGKILNYYHSVIHTLPHTESSLDKFQLGMKKLKDLVNNHINHIHKIVNRRNRGNIHTEVQFVALDHPKGNDPDFDSKMDYFPHES